MRLARAACVAFIVGAGLAVAWIAWQNLRGDAHFADSASSIAVDTALVERGAYLARAGNCAACHTARGGAEYAGGRGIATPFGTVYAGNLTPDLASGLGGWSAGDFWRAMHNGRSRDGRLLYPAFPYPNLTQVTRADSDAIFAFLRTRPAIAALNRPHELRFPYGRQWALAVWRALYFRAETFVPQPQESAQWNRGAYLVRGLGHCDACHSPRNALGASSDKRELAGGLIPVQNWYAPALAAGPGDDRAARRVEQLATWLKTGTSAEGSAQGPMAEVVFRSTQHLDQADLRAMATFIVSLPADESARGASAATKAAPPEPEPAVMARGAEVYRNRCADCHGSQGQGAAGAYPPLAGNRRIMRASAANVLRVIVDGGFAPATGGNPRPYGMPPFGQALSDADLAAVATYVRNAWGNRAPPVSELVAMRLR